MKHYPCDCICNCSNIVTGAGQPKPGTPDMLCLPCWIRGVQCHDSEHHRPKPVAQ